MKDLTQETKKLFEEYMSSEYFEKLFRDCYKLRKSTYLQASYSGVYPTLNCRTPEQMRDLLDKTIEIEERKTASPASPFQQERGLFLNFSLFSPSKEKDKKNIEIDKIPTSPTPFKNK